MRRAAPAGLLLLLALVAASACRPAGASVTDTPAAGTATLSAVTPAGSTPAPTAAPSATGPAADISAEGDAVTVRGGVSLGSGPFDFPDPTFGLAELTGYQATLRLSFTGTEAGSPREWSQTYLLRSASDPAARQLTIEKTGQLDDGRAVFLAETAGVLYERLGDEACTARRLEPGIGIAGQEPAALLSGVIGADEAGSDPVEGLAARHYTFDERAVGLAEIAHAAGELWVAAEGGYLLKYVLQAEGGADYFGEDVEGTLRWEYTLSGAGQPADLALPADCPPGLIDAPRLPDAAAVTDAPGVLSYSTGATPAAVLAFYQQELPARGWQAAPEPVSTDTLAVQTFTQGAWQLELTVLVLDGVTSVQLVLGPAGP